jgi:four helix bundle protein
MEIALGSASEVEYQLLLARDLQYVDSQIFSELSNRVIEVKRMLYAFVKKLKTER